MFGRSDSVGKSCVISSEREINRIYGIPIDSVENMCNNTWKVSMFST